MGKDLKNPPLLSDPDEMEKQRTHHNQKAIFILKTVIHQRSVGPGSNLKNKTKKSICHPIPIKPETEGNCMFFIGVKDPRFKPING